MRLLLLSTVLFFSIQSFAAGTTKRALASDLIPTQNAFIHEFYVSPIANNGQAVIGFGPGITAFGFNVGYNYRLNSSPEWQLGGEAQFAYQSVSGGNNYTSYTLLVGPTYNFINSQVGINDSFFAFFHFGLTYYGSSGPNNNGATDGEWDLGGGKRFQLTSSITYRPSIYVSMTAPSSSLIWTIIPFSFGINL
jgi:hypothetical protein